MVAALEPFDDGVRVSAHWRELELLAVLQQIAGRTFLERVRVDGVVFADAEPEFGGAQAHDELERVAAETGL